MAKNDNLLISPNFGSGDYVAGSATCKPTIGGVFNSIPGDNLPGRTNSPAAEKEKLIENVPGGPSRS